MPDLESLFAERIVLIDGAMGTMIQRFDLTEKDFRGDILAEHPTDLQGDNDLLVLTRPDVIEDIHMQYLEAGSDIIETNTFSATSISQAEYGLGHLAAEMNLAAARIAKSASARHFAETGRQTWVAGSVGPTTVTLSAADDADDASSRSHGWDEVHSAYLEQVTALIEGGCDVILIETIFDVLNAKAAIKATLDAFDASGITLPIIISVTFIQSAGQRTVFGQSVEAFWETVRHAEPLCVGMNCGLGARELENLLRTFTELVDTNVHIYPNAGLPDPLSETGFTETEEVTASVVAELAADGLVNMVGGCCGTTPSHIRAIASAIEGMQTRSIPVVERVPSYAGLDRFRILPTTNLAIVGERLNVTGSARFRALISDQDLEGALSVALDQVRNGANILDINFDEGMLESEELMQRFLNLISTEPDIATKPVMVDSSDWAVIESGLKCIQGKPVVNSISLKEGEDEFIARARLAKRYGAAVVVMGFDESGQAETVEHKVEIASRAQRLLTEVVGLHPSDIIHDPNILAIGTGLEEHCHFAVNFIEACKQIREQCEGSMVSGGVSNLSFAFRGNDTVRQAINAVFLERARQAGLSMAIVNPSTLTILDNIDPELLSLAEDLVLNLRSDATERMLAYAASSNEHISIQDSSEQWRDENVEERLSHAIVNGITEFIDVDVAEAFATSGVALDIIEGPLMDGMAIVGELFGSGRMFLPQVVKSARVMKRAVKWLEPYMEAKAGGHGRGVVVLATVKGDVHDIGKNIVGIVLECNYYEVHDLGVMVPLDTILAKAEEVEADIIGLSGLITPSLVEMSRVAAEMERRGLDTPLLIGGATTSARHTAIKLAPQYSKEVVHVLDASKVAAVVNELINPERRVEFAAELRRDQQRVASLYKNRGSVIPLAEARATKPELVFDSSTSPPPDELGSGEEPISLDEAAQFIDWTFFFSAWGMPGKFPSILKHRDRGEQARELHSDGLEMLQSIIAEGSLSIKALSGWWPAHSRGDDIEVLGPDREQVLGRFHHLRQQRSSGEWQRCLSDFIAPHDNSHNDHIGAFAVAVFGVEALASHHQEEGDDYSALLVKTIADRLAEASAELLHSRIRERLGFAEELTMDEIHRGSYRSIRPAYGYPACPDHSEKELLLALLVADEHGFTLTENFATTPASSVSGLFFIHPEARYFSVLRIGEDQVSDLAARKGCTEETVRRWLSEII